MAYAILHKSTMVIEVRGLTRGLTGEPITDATVTATLTDNDGAPIGGQTWPLPLAYVGASASDYRGLIRHDVVVAPKQKLKLEIDAAIPGDVHRHWSLDVAVVLDTGV
jgi:hypothetical protein